MIACFIMFLKKYLKKYLAQSLYTNLYIIIWKIQLKRLERYLKKHSEKPYSLSGIGVRGIKPFPKKCKKLRHKFIYCVNIVRSFSYERNLNIMFSTHPPTPPKNPRLHNCMPLYSIPS